MPTDLPDFDRAEYPESASSASRTSADFNGDASRADHARLLQAIGYGAIAATLSSIVYAAFTVVTHIEIGYLAVGVGYVVGRAMLHAAHGLGGRKYQVVAGVLTYLAVSMAAVPEILWSMRLRGMDISQVSTRGMVVLFQYGVASPFLKLQQSLGSGLIGLFILFVGIRAAWGYTADKRLAK